MIRRDAAEFVIAGFVLIEEIMFSLQRWKLTLISRKKEYRI
jgi:hypothetical protein